MSPTRENLLDSVNNWDKIATIIPAQVLQTVRGKTPIKKKENNIWGDDLTKEKEKGTLQIYFININGVCKQGNWEEYKRTIEVMKAYNMGVFAFAETNTAWTPQAQNRAKKITEQVHKKNYRIKTSSSNEMTVNQYQLGGTMFG
eukprot:388892-Ditylum_brightwellii.AAC.1